MKLNIKPNVYVSSKYEFKPDKNPGPGYYNPETPSRVTHALICPEPERFNFFG